MSAPLSFALSFELEVGEPETGVSRGGDDEMGEDRSLAALDPRVAATDGDRGGSGDRVK